MVRLAGNNSGVSSGLLFALLGSVSLHAGVLLLAPGISTSGSSIPHRIKAYLVPPAPEPQVTPMPPSPIPHVVAEPVKKVRLPEPAPAPVEPAVEQLAAPVPQVQEESQVADDERLNAASVDIGSPEPVYFPAGQMDVLPHLLGKVEQVYPRRAHNAGIEGYVTLSLLINERGEVDDIRVVKSQPAGFFEEAAIAMLRGQRFSPGIRQGKAVKGRWEKTIRYRLED